MPELRREHQCCHADGRGRNRKRPRRNCVKLPGLWEQDISRTSPPNDNVHALVVQCIRPGSGSASGESPFTGHNIPPMMCVLSLLIVPPGRGAGQSPFRCNCCRPLRFAYGCTPCSPCHAHPLTMVLTTLHLHILRPVKGLSGFVCNQIRHPPVGRPGEMDGVGREPKHGVIKHNYWILRETGQQ